MNKEPFFGLNRDDSARLNLIYGGYREDNIVKRLWLKAFYSEEYRDRREKVLIKKYSARGKRLMAKAFEEASKSPNPFTGMRAWMPTDGCGYVTIKSDDQP